MHTHARTHACTHTRTHTHTHTHTPHTHTHTRARMHTHTLTQSRSGIVHRSYWSQGTATYTFLFSDGCCCIVQRSQWDQENSNTHLLVPWWSSQAGCGLLQPRLSGLQHRHQHGLLHLGCWSVLGVVTVSRIKGSCSFLALTYVRLLFLQKALLKSVIILYAYVCTWVHVFACMGVH